MSNKDVTERETALLAKDLIYANSSTDFINAFNTFTRWMRLKYMFANSKSNPLPFHVKSSWQPPPQPVVLENYLEGTKLEIANLVCRYR